MSRYLRTETNAPRRNGLCLRFESDHRLTLIVGLPDVTKLVKCLSPTLRLWGEGFEMCFALPDADGGVDALLLIGHQIEADKARGRLHLREEFSFAALPRFLETLAIGLPPIDRRIHGTHLSERTCFQSMTDLYHERIRMSTPPARAEAFRNDENWFDVRAAFARKFELPCELLSRPQHSAYEAYGLLEGQLWQLMYLTPEGAPRLQEAVDAMCETRWLGREERYDTIAVGGARVRRTGTHPARGT